MPTLRTRTRVLGALALAALALAAPLLADAAGAQATRPAPPRGTAAAPAARELTADQQVRHVLGRLGFGARPGDVERVRALGIDRWIEEQLHPERIDDAALDAALARFPVLASSGAELLREYPPPGQVLARRTLAQRLAGGRPAGDTAMAAPRASLSAEDSAALRDARRRSARVLGELQTARVARAVASERQLLEVMVDFWESHFNVFAGKDRVRYFLPEYDATIRTHALGRFRDLLGAVARSPAMLQYLDNAQSVADSGRPTLATRRGAAARARRLAAVAPQLAARRPRGLNENYARELMELHTLGVDGGYTQRDVVEVARALTGWSVRPPAQGGGFVFRAEAHDAGEKVILGRRFPAGRGIEDGEEVLDLVARHPSTARFVARKLAQRFVSDTPPAALVERAAATFRRTDGDIRETVRTIVTSPEFFSRAAYRSKVKSPFELVVSAARALGAAVDTTPRTAQLVARLGQPLFGHQAPDGWPETGAAWMNTGAILNRINFGLAVAGNRLPGARLDAWPEARALRAAPREAQVDGVIAALLGGEASPDTRAVLASGENPLLGSPRLRAAAADSATMDAAAMAAAAGDTAGMPPRRTAGPLGGPPPRLGPFAQIVGLALGAPEFQRR